MPQNEPSHFHDQTFDDFRRLAQDDSLSRYEKIGFPNSYREGKEPAIFQDILGKLSNLVKKNQMVLDIGPGCSGLAFLLIELCRQNGHTLILVDSPEMLRHLPDDPFIVKVPGRYPDQCSWLFDQYAGKLNAILTYSVIQYVFAELNPFDFVDRSLGLLAEGGQMLIGDIPNVSKRKRFFASPNGVRFHQEFTRTTDVPAVEHNVIESGKMDDAVLLALLARVRSAGAEAYLLPQAADLPMANRREDILIVKP